MQRLFSFWSALVSLVCPPLCSQLYAADGDVCAICGRPFGDAYYSIEDKITLQKHHICKQCELMPFCFVCGLPANTNDTGYMQLPDRRVLCARDARTAVLRQEDGARICKDVQEELERLLSRFTSFPDEHVTIDVMDRVNLQSLFKLLGNDYQCPNVWGLTQTETNKNQLQFRISLMTGLPLNLFQATCAHEYGHTWVADHLSYDRKKTLDRDAEEGFCELLAFALMEARNDQPQQDFILRNPYTRGQIDLFVAAYHRFGFNEVLDWLQSGADGRLSAADPDGIRNLVPHSPTVRPAKGLVASTQAPKAAPDVLVLKGIIWDKTRPLVMINDQTLGRDEVARVHVGVSNLLVRCVSIAPTEVRVQLPELDKEQTLRLK
jgi:Protein DA1